MTSAAIHVVIPGICPAAPRPRARMVRVGVPRLGLKAVARIYTPGQGTYAVWIRAAQVIMRQSCGSRVVPFAREPIAVQLLFVMPLAQRDYRKSPVPRSWCRSHRRGDLDNLAKGPLDAANGVLWLDDCDVVSLHLYKIIGEQGEQPRVEVSVSCATDLPASYLLPPEREG